MRWFRRPRTVTVEGQIRGRHERRGRHEAYEPFGYIRFDGNWTAEQKFAFMTEWLRNQQRDLTPYSLQFKRDA